MARRKKLGALTLLVFTLVALFPLAARTAFHAQFNAEVLRFFRAQLGREPQ